LTSDHRHRLSSVGRGWLPGHKEKKKAHKKYS
jgi:hypothetical protein